MRRISLISLIVSLLVAVAPFGASTAAAEEQAAGTIVRENPARFTPHALDGQVYSVVQVGSTMVVGGTFTTARDNNSSAVLSRNRIMAFDATTGRISTTFNPSANGTINVVLPAGDGTVYVGGSFTQIAGQSVKNLARLRVSDGSLVTSFNGGSPSGVVKDLSLAQGRLWVAGAFTHIAGRAQAALATLNPTTGSFDSFFTGSIQGVHKRGSYTTGMKMDANPQGTRMTVVGNFDTLDGAKNHQLFVLDISGASAKQADFQTNFFNAACSSSYDSYMRDVDYSPDGSFFVVSTTGAYGGYGDSAPCDTAARFDISASGSSILPTWVNYTGGDTSYAVEITDTAVYIGGHQRWWNNPYADNRIGPGAVSRPGIAALNPLNGIPFSWNPTRDRGIGVFDLLSTAQGLWVVSDTDRIGNYEYHARIAMFPAQGKDIPAYSTAPFPNAVYTVSSSSINPALQRREYDGSTVGAATTVSGTPIRWSTVKGAFMVNGQLYLANSDGSFNRRDFDGTSFGAATPVNGQDKLSVLQEWRNDISSMTGMFFDSGRIYYTLNNSSTLYYRYFNIESDIVGAVRMNASGSISGVDFSRVAGMFLGGDALYWATSDGNLHSTGWKAGLRSGAPVAGTARIVSGPRIDSTQWSSRVMFLYQGTSGEGALMSPKAAFTADCTSRECTFDPSDSVTPGASISSYSWDFGDGSTSTEQKPTRVFSSDGTFQVKLTIKSSAGQSATATRGVEVRRVNVAPTAQFSVTCTELTCVFDATASKDPDGQIASYTWDFGDGNTATGASPRHTFGAGSHTVSLTVKDNDGAAHTTERKVDAQAAQVSFVAADAVNSNRSVHQVTIPSQVREGDALLLFLTINSNADVKAPDGWEELQRTDGSGVAGRVWTKAAGSNDAGASVKVTLSTYAKGDISVVAYRSTTGAYKVADSVSATSNATTVAELPALKLSGTATPVYYLGAKTSSAVTATLPQGITQRSSTAGSGGGAVVAWGLEGGATGAETIPAARVSLSSSVNRVIVYGIAVAAK